jgi:hypothetical protein
VAGGLEKENSWAGLEFLHPKLVADAPNLRQRIKIQISIAIIIIL